MSNLRFIRVQTGEFKMNCTQISAVGQRGIVVWMGNIKYLVKYLNVVQVSTAARAF